MDKEEILRQLKELQVRFRRREENAESCWQNTSTAVVRASWDGLATAYEIAADELDLLIEQIEGEKKQAERCFRCVSFFTSFLYAPRKEGFCRLAIGETHFIRYHDEACGDFSPNPVVEYVEGLNVQRKPSGQDE